MPEKERVFRDDITARPALHYRVKAGLIFAVLMGVGLWSLYDGYIKWPRQNEEQKRIDPKNEKVPHGYWDILLNRVIGWTLPPAAIGFLVFLLRRSRGQYRFRDKILHVPGHPPIPLAAVRSVERKKWDRKGIAYVNYQLPNGMKGRARLDCIIYQEDETDEIFQIVEEHLAEREQAEAGE